MAVIPYEISCGVLIHVFCQKIQDNEGWDSEYVSKGTQQTFLIGLLKMLKKTNSTWHEFVDTIKSFCWEDLYNSFLKEVELLETEDDILDVFKSLEELVIDQSSSIKLSTQNTPIKRTSVIGLFLRKLVLKFKKLTFEKIHLLFMDYVKYKQLSNPFEETKQSLEDSERSMDLSCVDENTTSDVSLIENESKENQPSPVKIIPKIIENQKTQNNLSSREGVYQFIEENVIMLENNSHNVMKPNQLQLKLNEIQRSHWHIPDVYYLSFLNYLRVSEFNKASKMLSLYFDQKNFQNQGTNADPSEQENHQSMFKRFRYGALNHGIMHYQHGNYAQAMTVLKEAVSIAQETNDELCLKHAIFWIHVVKEETNRLDNKDLESRCCELIKEI
ncbi:anaphase-promoting complex subunit 5-like [Clytia hemisphaerica]|uniref:Anaphase-promoting complex subunit 5 n=1 Tax=Clytia hemisphaerica TaxID=252671 RepID=A0A7M6DM24_9CNID